MKKFWTSKKLWFFLLILFGIGVFIFFFLFPKELLGPTSPEEESLPEEVKKDKVSPTSRILSPENKSWWGRDFEVSIRDSDIGSGLADFNPRQQKGCQYLIVDLGTEESYQKWRQCGTTKITVPVGQDKVCSSSLSPDNDSLGKCHVATQAFDKAGNSSGWQSKTFNIDLVKPEVGQITLEKNLELNQQQVFRAEVSDNGHIIGCWFYIDREAIDALVNLSPIPCHKGDACSVSTTYSFLQEGTFRIYFGCQDAAKNVAFGKPTEITISSNHSPQASSCRVSPTRGSPETEFRFQAEVQDPEGDRVSYVWHFGDGETSTQESPFHFYKKPGVFQPHLVVFDDRGGQGECSPAWVVVEE